MASKFRSTSMFVTFIRAENTKALINQTQLVASGMQGKTCLGKETACYRCGRIIYSASMLWSSSTQNVTILSCNKTHAAASKGNDVRDDVIAELSIFSGCSPILTCSVVISRLLYVITCMCDSVFRFSVSGMTTVCRSSSFQTRLACYLS